MSKASISRASNADGPREKLERVGAGALGDQELLAIVLGHGTVRASALTLASALLDRAVGLHGLTRLTPDEIRQTRGIGQAQAARVYAALELGRRTLARPAAARPRLASPDECAEFLLPRFGAYPVERFGLILLDTRHRLLRSHVHSVGSLDASLANPRDIFRVALGAGASTVVLFHNHPSGDPAPSPEDVRLTQRLASAGLLIGVPVLDHLILADGLFYSFRKDGVL